MMLSATDVSNFELCKCHIINKYRKEKGDDTLSDNKTRTLLEYQKQGVEIEKKYFENIKKSKKLKIFDVSKVKYNEKSKETLRAIKEGYDYIYQGYFCNDSFIGFPDFLKKVDLPSKLGNYSYEVIDVKRSKDPKQENISQLLTYSMLLEEVQGIFPKNIIIINGKKLIENKFRVEDFYERFIETKDELLKTADSISKYSINKLKKELINVCEYNSIYIGKPCETIPPVLDLINVVDLDRRQKRKLIQYISNMEDLSSMKVKKISGISEQVLSKLIKQAQLQLKKIKTGKESIEIIHPLMLNRGFNKLPMPSSNDLFFDIEGDPTTDGGHEYLFGVIEGKNQKFYTFWASNLDDEKKAFEKTMHFLKTHILKHPDAHIYHYNHYEVTQLKRLATKYDTCNEILDYFLWNNKFIDLYKVVKQSIITSENGRSIKDLEIFYMKKRDTSVSSGEDSIEKFLEWKETGKMAILKEIENYNKDDCISTKLLLQWLHSIKPKNVQFYIQQETKEINIEEVEKISITKKKIRKNLKKDHIANNLIADMLEFHRRENKSEWWLFFDRKEKDYQELVDDMNAIAGCEKVNYEYNEKGFRKLKLKYPDQEFKIAIDKKLVDLNSESMNPFATLTDINYKKREIELIATGKNKPIDEIPNHLDLGSDRPIDIRKLLAAIYRFANDYAGKKEFRSIYSLINSEVPKFKNNFKLKKDNINADLINYAIEAVSSLDKSYLFIQGPPGTGKTYTTAKVILSLLKNGKKIAITTNSHKAINQLLSKIDELSNFKFRGLKIYSKSSEGSKYESDNIDAIDRERPYKKNDPQPLVFHEGEYQLLACTKFKLVDPDLINYFDYLFIDEAGQFSIADTVITAMSSKNLILIGDPQQLSQPSSIIHPGDSGLSALQYILREKNTVDKDKGIFIEETRRLNNKINHFISQNFYDCRLISHDSTNNRKLKFKDNYLKTKEGIILIETDHEDNSQNSEEEIIIINKIYSYLLTGTITENNKSRDINTNDILVVAPYNVQVNQLSQKLPKGNRTGTVDKFQGQEAAISILSMTASDTDEAPRGIEFLFDYRRLNVAISRAQCISIIVMNKGLFKSRARNIKQIQLANNFDKLRKYATRIEANSL